MKPFKLKRTVQCEKCPWRAAVDPNEIPNGYSQERHAALADTIADPDNIISQLGKELRVMACHELHEAHCVGWLDNQLGDGNNVMLRYQMRDCTNLDKLRLRGEQHKCFEDTLPKASAKK